MEKAGEKKMATRARNQTVVLGEFMAEQSKKAFLRSNEKRCQVFPRSDTVTTCLALLELDQITAPDRSASQHRGINSDVHLVVFRGRAQDARIFRQISLGQRRHDTAGAR